MLVLARASNLSSVLDGDALASATTAETIRSGVRAAAKTRAARRQAARQAPHRERRRHDGSHPQRQAALRRLPAGSLRGRPHARSLSSRPDLGPTDRQMPFLSTRSQRAPREGRARAPSHPARQRLGEGEEGELLPPILMVIVALGREPLIACGRMLRNGSQPRERLGRNAGGPNHPERHHEYAQGCEVDGRVLPASIEYSYTAVARQLGIDVEVVMAKTMFSGFVGMIRPGQMDAVLVSLPCSIFSRAGDGQSGPRRLRKVASAGRHGLPNLALAQKM